MNKSIEVPVSITRHVLRGQPHGWYVRLPAYVAGRVYARHATVETAFRECRIYLGGNSLLHAPAVRCSMVKSGGALRIYVPQALGARLTPGPGTGILLTYPATRNKTLVLPCL